MGLSDLPIDDPHGKLKNIDEIEPILIENQKVGTKFKIETKNSTYFMELLDNKGRINIQGGSYFKEITETYFSGCTFGGSMLWQLRLSPHMCMELKHPTKIGVLTTSDIISIELITDWNFTLDLHE